MNQEMQEMAKQLENMTGGNFNPFAMMAGQTNFHSVFVAPMTDTMKSNIKEFLENGTGEYFEIVEELMQHQKLSAVEANSKAKEIVTNIIGTTAIVLKNDDSITIVPTPFFGHLETEYIDHVSASVPELQDKIKAAFLKLKKKLETGNMPPNLFIGEKTNDAQQYWASLAESIIDGINNSMMSAAGMHKENCDWIINALDENKLNGDELLNYAKCSIIAENTEKSMNAIEKLFKEYEMEEEEALELAEEIANQSIKTKSPKNAVKLFKKNIFEEALGDRCYELELAKLKVIIASNSNKDDLSKAVKSLENADKKSFRNDINKEPIWEIVVKIKDEETLLDAREASDEIERSLHFVEKRIENKTIPIYKKGENYLIPKQALLNWIAIIEEYKVF